uniref:Uncharacterized protein n=1 Tax=Oryza rufipogon TaxID=4529 RepID=A0A0E0Q9X8_ORYRU
MGPTRQPLLPLPSPPFFLSPLLSLLYIDHNPLVMPPKEVVAGGVAAVKGYMARWWRDARAEAAPSPRAPRCRRPRSGWCAACCRWAARCLTSRGTASGRWQRKELRGRRGRSSMRAAGEQLGKGIARRAVAYGEDAVEVGGWHGGQRRRGAKDGEQVGGMARWQRM